MNLNPSVLRDALLLKSTKECCSARVNEFEEANQNIKELNSKVEKLFQFIESYIQP